MDSVKQQVLPIASSDPISGPDPVTFNIDLAPIKALGDQVSLKPDRLFIAGRGADWKIWSILIDGREQLDQELPGEVFEPQAHPKTPWLDVLRSGSSLSMTVARRGDDQARFVGALICYEVPSEVPQRAYSGSIRFRDRSGVPIVAPCSGPDRVLPGQAARFVAKPSVLVRVDLIVLDLGAGEWTIEDLRCNGRGQLAAAGSIPGEVFGPGLVDSVLRTDPLGPGQELSITATYRGTNPRGRAFGATCYCTTR